MYFMLTGSHPFHVKGDTEATYLKKLQVEQNLELPEGVQVSDM